MLKLVCVAAAVVLAAAAVVSAFPACTVTVINRLKYDSIYLCGTDVQAGIVPGSWFKQQLPPNMTNATAFRQPCGSGSLSQGFTTWISERNATRDEACSWNPACNYGTCQLPWTWPTFTQSHAANLLSISGAANWDGGGKGYLKPYSDVGYSFKIICLSAYTSQPATMTCGTNAGGSPYCSPVGMPNLGQPASVITPCMADPKTGQINIAVEIF
jgi:hypothetical protein